MLTAGTVLLRSVQSRSLAVRSNCHELFAIVREFLYLYFIHMEADSGAEVTESRITMLHCASASPHPDVVPCFYVFGKSPLRILFTLSDD